MDFVISEHIYLFLVGALLFLVVLLPFVHKEIRKKQKSRMLVNRIIPVSTLTEQQISQIETRHPSGKKMHPAINRSMCVGCGTCVLTCKRKESLFIIEAKSTLVNPLACVGCGECEKACPLGANQLVEYGKRMKVRVPDVDENFESNIKGIYVIGSLAGAGLIKEAINQGRAVLNHIMKNVFPGKEPQVLIVGSGPAGLSALLSSRKFGLPAACLEMENRANTIRSFPKNKIVMAEPAEMPLFGPLWVGNTTREKLLAVWDKILKTTQAPITVGAKLEAVRKEGDRFVVSASGKDYVCDKVILALGTRGEPRRLGVPGEDSAKVFYSLTDVAEFAKSRVAIVGAGDSAIESALALFNQGCRITLVVRGDGFPKAKGRNREKILAAIEQGYVQAFFNGSVKEIKSKSLIVSTPAGDSEIENDYVFVMVGGELPFPLLEKVGIRIIDKEI
jgi:thioredoxin reductase (NADPH)